MFFLNDMFLDQNSLSFSINDTLVNDIRIQNGIFDHLNLLNIISLATNEFDKTIPTEWTNQTLMDANFRGTLNAGSINNIIANVDHLDIQRKEQGSDEWITLQQIFKDYKMQELKTNFTMTDTYGKNNTLYTYRILPIDENGNSGTAIQQQDILSIFSHSYIADAEHIYVVTNEYTLNKQKNQISTIYTPYGSKYPFVAYNAETQYDSGSLTAVLLAPTSQYNKSAYLDREAQVALCEEFNNWLTNGRAKILKDINGNFKIITITGSIQNEYYKELGNGLASTTFQFDEVGEFTQKYLDSLGLKNKFPILSND